MGELQVVAWRTAAVVAWDSLPFAVLGWLRYTGRINGLALHDIVAFWVVSASLVVALGGLRGLDSRHRTERRGMADGRFAIGFFIASTFAAWSAVLVARGVLDFRELELMWVATPAWWMLGRRIFSAPQEPERVLVVGRGRVAARVAELLRRQAGGCELVGSVDRRGSSPPGATVLGEVEDLAAIVVRHRIDRVVVTFASAPDHTTMEALRACDALGVQVDIVPRMFDLVGEHSQLASIGTLPVVRIHPRANALWHARAKRVADLVVAVPLLLATLPLMAAVALAIRLLDGRPLLFRQERIGRYGRPFQIVKFRTMREESGVERELVLRLLDGASSSAETVDSIKQAGGMRTTTLGALLRRTSLDELPQLWNVIRGEMSVVGPRPLRRFEVDTLERWQQSRLLVRPGITGLWQVRGRSDVGWEERLQMDYTYVRHHSGLADLRILIDTVAAVTARRGAM